MRARFEVFSFDRSRDMEWSLIFKNRSGDPFTTLYYLILHFLITVPVVNLSVVKFHANIFVSDRWLFYYFAVAAKCRVPLFCGVFWGDLTP